MVDISVIHAPFHMDINLSPTPIFSNQTEIQTRSKSSLFFQPTQNTIPNFNNKITYLAFGRLLSTYLESNSINFVVLEKNKGFVYQFDNNKTLIERYLLLESHITELTGQQLDDSFQQCGFAIEFIYTDSGLCRIYYINETLNTIETSEILNRLPVVLQNMLSNLNQPINTVSLLSAKEKDEYLAPLEQTIELPNKTLHQLIEEQVEKTPDAIALTFIEEQLTYRQMNNRANQLASIIKSTYHIQQGDIITISIPPSFHMIITMLATWKIGAACFLLDPRNPTAQIHRQFSETKSPLLITTDTFFQKYLFSIAPNTVNTLIIQNIADQLNNQDTPNPAMNIPTLSPATVFYTSGSTGDPHAVLNGHLQFVNAVVDMQHRFNVDNNDVVLLLTNCSFDPIISEIVLPLIVGAQCTILPRIIAESPIQLKNHLDTHSISLMQVTPITLQLLDEVNWTPHPTLKILCGGSSLPKALATKFHRIYLRYGTTETTTYSSEASWEQKVDTLYDPKDIGTPILNTVMLPLDHNGQISPYGSLHIGGAGLALGYLNTPGNLQSYNNFTLPNGKKVKMYDTGDYVIRLPDHSFKYIGRRDSLVKIYGQRISLDYIEEKTIEYLQLIHPSINAPLCKALTFQDRYGTDTLAVFIAPNIELDHEAIKLFLSQHLPSIAIPSHFHTLPTMPITPNRKVDRNHLFKLLEEEILNKESPIDTTSTSVPEVIATHLSKIIGISKEKIDHNQNFFTLGGTSLKMMHLRNALKTLCPTITIADVYGAPSVNLLSKRIVEKLLDKKDCHATLPAIRTHALPDAAFTFPLSTAQADIARMYDALPVAYNTMFTLRVNEEINKNNIVRAIHLLVDYYSILRTNIIKNDAGKLLQIVQIAPSVDDIERICSIRNAKNWTEKEISQFLANEQRKPFNLSSGIPIRVQILETNAAQYYLGICMPHTHIDGISEQIICQKLLLAYDALQNSRQVPFARPKIQYYDFALWQKEILENTTEYLAPYLQTLETTLDEIPKTTIYSDSRHRHNDHEGRQFFFTLSPELKKQCETFAHLHQGSLFTVVCTAYFALLQHYCDENRIAIGIATSGRYMPEISECIGQFATLSFLSLTEEDLPNHTTFSSLHTTIFQKVQSMLDTQIIPYQEQLKIMRKHNCEPPEVMLAYNEENDSLSLSFPHVTLDPVMIENTEAKASFTLIIFVKQHKIECAIEYKTSVYQDTFVQQFAKHLKRILASLTIPTLTELSLDQFNPITDDERQKLQKIGTGQSVSIPSDQNNIVKLFNKVAQSHPDRPALIFGSQEFTYRELDEKSNQLARFLRAQNIQIRSIGNEDIVAICMSKSIETYISILAILKSGGAFIAIPPRLPPQDFLYRLEESKTKLVLTVNKDRSALPKNSFPIIELDTDQRIISYSTEPLSDSDNILPNNLAYAIGSSGSSGGRPKISESTHIGTVNTIRFAISKLGTFSENDRCSAWAQETFDAFIWETFLALLSGSALCIPANNRILVETSLIDYLTEYQISVAAIPPSVLQQTKPTTSLSNLRIIVSGGEPCSKEIVRKWATDKRKFFNSYGLSENHICLTLGECFSSEASTPALGQPTDNVSLVVLDQQQRLVPIGAPGEIYAFGPYSLARGYTQPELSQKVFVNIQHPFHPSETVRALKTGDTASWNHDGKLIFIRRSNTNEIKVSGVRVDCEGMKQLLLSSQLLESCIILAWNNPKDIKDIRIFAFIVLKKNNSSVQDTIGQLKELMVNHYLPAIRPKMIIPLDTIPLTSHGKIDTKQLKVIIEEKSLKTAIAKNPPITQIEKQLAIIWSHLLQIPLNYIEKNDDFFALGGSSQQVIELINTIEREWSNLLTPISPKTITHNATLKELANFIQTNQNITGKQTRKRKTYQPKSNLDLKPL